MSKPEDIQQEVWDRATDTFDKILCNSGYEGSRDDSIADLARAILAAKAEEREACALLADARWQYYDKMISHGQREHGHPEYVRDSTWFSWMGHGFEAQHIANAIRKRGEA